MTTLTSIRDGAWLARQLLTPEEQSRLREAAEAQGMPPAGKDSRLRDCDRAELINEELSETIWQRLQGLVPDTVVVDEDGEERGLPSSERILHGTWQACGINPLFRVVRYAGNGVGHFGPHKDAAFEKSLRERSLLTVNGYLNELPEGVGGCTRFVLPNLELQYDERGRFTTPASAVTHAIRPEAGAAVVFFHGLMHDGEPLSVGSPPKWLFRTEVMYRREDVEDLAAEDVEARRLDVIAESVERTNATIACELNKLSHRLRERRISAEAAQQRAAPLLRELGGEPDLEEEEEVSDLPVAPEEEEEEEEGVESRRELVSSGREPTDAGRGERLYTCARCGSALFKVDFVGRCVRAMDAALALHTRGLC